MPDPESILSADPRASWAAHAIGVSEAIERVLRSGKYILGPEVKTFEREWAAYVGCAFSIGVANKTDTLELTLRTAGISAGDVVVTAANTVTATAAAIERTGASLALADIDPASFTLSPAALAE